MLREGLLTKDDLFYFREGTHARLYEKMGAHCVVSDGRQGTYFSVWAPNAKSVSVIGDFNDWTKDQHPLYPREDGSGVWEGFCPDVGNGALYKYHIVSRFDEYSASKGDPFAFKWESAPETASIVTDLSYTWNDQNWMAERHKHNALDAPMSVYELHIGSWQRIPEEDNRKLSYLELADRLIPYLQEMAFTHVELMPVMEHPFYGSWGYQVTGYFAPSSRYGTPQDFMCLIDKLHQNGIGVILDWVPSHFPSDEHGLAYFDGTHLYEHADPMQRVHADWGSYLFNYGRHEVVSFLISNALFWLDKYHVDGLRIDAVASMLYLDYSRKEGEWVPNRHGGREDLEAIAFLKQLNSAVYEAFPDVQTIAEESTSWPMVSRPTYLGGLGFGMKWNMGWMHDTLSYLTKDPVFRQHHHDQLTFSICYAFSENFQLPLSHDEVVHGKGSLINKMPGNEAQRFANLKLLFGYFYGHPGKKLLFMGGEFGQKREWDHDRSLDWHLLDQPTHDGLRLWVGDLNRFYRSEEALYKGDFDAQGFEWIDCHDHQQSVLSFLRRSEHSDTTLIFLFNFTPVTRLDYRIGLPSGGYWQEVLNSDALQYGGEGKGNFGGLNAELIPCHNRPYSLSLTLPSLSTLVFKKVQSS